MARRGNVSKSVPFGVTLAEQSVEILERLARLGPYGRNAPEVGGRLLEQVLTDQFSDRPKFRLDRLKPRKKKGAGK